MADNKLERGQHLQHPQEPQPPGPAGDSSLAPTPAGLTDAQWEASAARLQAAQQRYADLDIGALAAQGAGEYVKARDALGSAADTAATMALTQAARLRTASMAAGLQLQTTATERLRTLSGFAFVTLLPIFIGLGAISAGQQMVSLIALPRAWLVAGFGLLLAFALLLVLDYVTRGFVVQHFSGPVAASLAIGVVASAVALPLLVRQGRQVELLALSASTSEVRAALIDSLAERERGAGSSPLTLDSSRYTTVALPADADAQLYKISAAGLPGVMLASLKEDSGAVTWQPPGRASHVKARVEFGELVAAPQGGLVLQTRSEEIPFIQADSHIKAAPHERGVAAIDPDTGRVVAWRRVGPVTPDDGAAKTTGAAPATEAAKVAAEAREEITNAAVR